MYRNSNLLENMTLFVIWQAISCSLISLKTFKKRRQCWLLAFPTFPTIFWKKLLSLAFKQDSSKLLLFGKEIVFHPCFSLLILTLSQTTNFRLSQTEEFADNDNKSDKNGRNFFKQGRKHSGKRRNFSLQAISPFPKVFSKALYCRHVKTRACLGKGKFWSAPVISFDPFTNKPWFYTCMQYKSFENTVGKGEISHYEFSPF